MKTPSRPKPLCTVPDCGRPSSARGMCQTHHRQLLTTGKLKPIRPYRRRRDGTVKFSGLRLSPECAEALDQGARSQGTSGGAVIAEVLEGWAARKAGTDAGGS